MEQQRMEFEKAFKLKWEIGHFILKMVKFVEESQDYAPVNAVKQMSDEYYWVLALNTGWWAWLAAQQQDGYVMVPVEPTERMLDCAYSSISDNLHYADLENIYRAMTQGAQELPNKT